jgi:hypothetical protein
LDLIGFSLQEWRMKLVGDLIALRAFDIEFMDVLPATFERHWLVGTNC